MAGSDLVVCEESHLALKIEGADFTPGSISYGVEEVPLFVVDSCVITYEPLQVDIVVPVEVIVSVGYQSTLAVLKHLIVVPVIILELSNSRKQFIKPQPCHHSEWGCVLNVVMIGV